MKTIHEQHRQQFQSSPLLIVSQKFARCLLRSPLLSSMDSALIDHASATHDSNSSSEDEGISSQDPWSANPPTVPPVDPTQKHKRWLDTDKEYLVLLRQNRMSWEDISRRLTENNPYLGNRSPEACRKKYNAVSDKPRDCWPYTASEEQLLFSLRKPGYPPTKLGDEFPE